MKDTILLYRTLDPAATTMAIDLDKVYSNSALSRTYLSGGVMSKTSLQSFQAPMSSIIGRLAGDSFLSDVTLTFALHNVCLGLESCYVFDPVRIAQKNQRLPAQDLKTIDLIIMPVNIDNLHWVIIFVHIDVGMRHIGVSMYDPMVSPEFHSVMRATWDTFGLLSLQDWWRRDCDQTSFPPDIAINTIDKPKRDGFNCGVLCVAQASCVVQSRSGTQHNFSSLPYLSRSKLQTLRLRMLWEMMCFSRVKTTGVVRARLERASEEINSYFKKT